MSNNILIYGNDISPSVKAVIFTLKELNLEYTLKTVDISKNEHKAEEFVKKNPAHTIPFIEVEGKYISDSHAINAFLASKYGKDDKLYPKDLFKRAVVDQRLHYENGVIFYGNLKALRPIITGDGISKEKFNEIVKSMLDVYNVIEAYLNENKYIADDHITIADLSYLASVPIMGLVAPLDAGKWPKLVAWLDNLKKLPYYEEVSGAGMTFFETMLKSSLDTFKN